MNDLARKTVRRQPALECGYIHESRAGVFTVVSEGERYAARKAVSCLVYPEKGDTVLLAFDAAGQGYILSVLERPGGETAPKTLEMAGQVQLRIQRGGLNIAAAETLSLTSEQQITIAAERLNLDARQGSARIEELSFFGRLFHSQVETVKHIADTLDTVVRRAVQRLTASYRYIEEHEEIQSASTRMLVEGTLTMQTQNTMHTAEGHIKIDAEQIHLG